jgi:hypothetical protein
MTLVLFRAGRSLLAGELKNKGPGPVLHLEARYAVGEGSPKVVCPALVKVHESLVVNPAWSTQTWVSESEPLNYRELLHESLIPHIAFMRGPVLGERTVIAYERDRRGVGFQEADGVSWSSLNDLLADATIGETLALEAVREKLVERKMLDETYRGTVSEAVYQVTERFGVYMKCNPFRDKTLIREGTEVRCVGYYQGCVVVEADGEEFWMPIEETNLFSEEYKNDLWYFHMDDDADGLPDPLTALPSKVALRTHSKRNRGTMQWDAKGDMKKVAGHLTPEPKIDNEYTVMGESFLGTFIHHFWRHGEPERYDIAAKPGGADKAKTKPEDAIKRQEKDRRRSNKVLTAKHSKDAVPRDFQFHDHSVSSIDDGTVAENSVDALVDHILSGASVNAIFAERLDPEQEKKNREEALAKAFPGAQKLIAPALRQSAVSP